jgi:glycine oxidase
MRQPEHIAIAGGGIIGLACALVLKERGLQVTVFEAGEAVREASWAAGGMLAAEDPENPVSLLPFSRYSRDLYPSFLALIERLSGRCVPLRTHQTVQLIELGRASLAGVPLSHHQAAELVPGLAESNHTYLLLEEASLDPRELCTSLRSAVAIAGVTFHDYEPVLSAQTEGHRVLLSTARRALQADAFVNCCGAWASSLYPGAAITPSKGQMLVVRQPAKRRLTCVLRSPDVYLIPRGQGSGDSSRILIGATVEDAGYSHEVDDAALSLLRRRAAALWPPAADAPEVESWAGLRPGTADGLPLIGLTQQAAQSGDRDASQFLAAGHHRNGILLAPGTAHVIADLVCSRSPAIDLSPFSPNRTSLPAGCDKHFAAAL